MEVVWKEGHPWLELPTFTLSIPLEQNCKFLDGGGYSALMAMKGIAITTVEKDGKEVVSGLNNLEIGNTKPCQKISEEAVFQAVVLGKLPCGGS